MSTLFEDTDQPDLQPGEYLYLIRPSWSRGPGGAVFSPGTSIEEALDRAGIQPEDVIRSIPCRYRPLDDITDDQRAEAREAKADRGRQNLKNYREKKAQEIEVDPNQEVMSL